MFIWDLTSALSAGFQPDVSRLLYHSNGIISVLGFFDLETFALLFKFLAPVELHPHIVLPRFCTGNPAFLVT